jgi:DNA-binding XRE family transcriptional regulator
MRFKCSLKCWRKGWVVRPFCQLVIKAIRHDSPPYHNESQSLCKLLLEKRLAGGFTQEALAERLEVSLRTLKNWERGWTQPRRKYWACVQLFLG